MNTFPISSLRQVPDYSLSFFLAAGLFLLLGLLVWAVCWGRRSNASAAAARQALNMQQGEARTNTQSMTAANALLVQASGRFQELFQGLPTACVCFDKDGRIMEWNRAFEQLYALPDMLGASIWNTIYSGTCRPEIEAAAAAVFAGASQEGIERIFQRADGSEVHLYGSIFPLRGADGEITGAISTDIDISAQKQAEEALRRSEERFRIAIASISEGLIVLDAAGVVTLWNDSAEQILEMTRTEVHGLRPVNPEFAAVREDGTKFPQGSYPLMASLRRGVPQHNVVMGLPRRFRPGGLPGEMLWVSVNAKPLFRAEEAKPYAVVATFADISERRRTADQISRQMVQITEYAAVLEQQKCQLEDANRQLETLALHDSLTGLGNRRAFELRLLQEMNLARRYGTALSLLLLDVDSFKAYNDGFGHPAGDEVLRRLAVIIRDQGRETDFFARYGGEEFIVILPLTDADGAMVLAERLRIAVENARWPARPVTASIGAATLLAEMDSEEALVSAADQALYAAKTAGRNCVLHAAEFTEVHVSIPLLLAA